MLGYYAAPNNPPPGFDCAGFGPPKSPPPAGLAAVVGLDPNNPPPDGAGVVDPNNPPVPPGVEACGIKLVGLPKRLVDWLAYG